MKTRDEHIANILGDAKYLETMRSQGLDAAAHQMREDGIEKKGLKQENATDETPETNDEQDTSAGVVLAEVVEAQADQAVELDQIKSQLTEQQKSKDDEIKSLKEELQSLHDMVVKMQSENEYTPKRASESERTKANDDQAKELGKVKTNENAEQIDSFFGDLNVPASQGGI